MKRRKIIKTGLITALIGIVIATGIGLYLYNKPHRDVQAADADYSLSSSQLVEEYLSDMTAANKKYLAADGNSKILEVTGSVANISEDFKGQMVILLKEEDDDAGVSATLINTYSELSSSLNIGDRVTVKGVIRSGASYDEDLELYEHVILDKGEIISK